MGPAELLFIDEGSSDLRRVVEVQADHDQALVFAPRRLRGFELWQIFQTSRIVAAPKIQKNILAAVIGKVEGRPRQRVGVKKRRRVALLQGASIKGFDSADILRFIGLAAGDFRDNDLGSAAADHAGGNWRSSPTGYDNAIGACRKVRNGERAIGSEPKVDGTFFLVIDFGVSAFFPLTCKVVLFFGREFGPVRRLAHLMNRARPDAP